MSLPNFGITFQPGKWTDHGLTETLSFSRTRLIALSRSFPTTTRPAKSVAAFIVTPVLVLPFKQIIQRMQVLPLLFNPIPDPTFFYFLGMP
ncbi:hypothetical protein AVEN_192630-1 [Araneus ventricosus]|uniref:Uncharacterized protein n=1 Tax=Araneus ventricosus TaxID=182803 RepID=A0A4Y2TAG3_ARAVE|nr:hypothetical protein AVEN_192630-1 [Araneus ventricosus]